MWACSKLEQDKVFSSGSPLPWVEYPPLSLPEFPFLEKQRHKSSQAPGWHAIGPE